MMRVGPQAVTLSCPNCRNNYPAELINIIDAGANPVEKEKILAGNLNVTRCPSCQATNPIVVPILYHDAGKDLCITHIPPELNLTTDQQEKIVGELLNGLMSSLAQEKRRGYLFQPRSSLSMQNLREQILTAEGFSEEEIQQQRKLNELLQQLLSAPAHGLPGLIHQLDDRIDEPFIAAVSVLQSQLPKEEQAETLVKIGQILQCLMEESSAGRKLQEQSEQQLRAIETVQNDINELGKSPSNVTIRELALRYLEEEENHLEWLVTAIRPALDYAFYQELTASIAQAESTHKEQLVKLRKELLDISARVDEMQRLALARADALVNRLLASTDPDEAILQHLPDLDRYFFQALGEQLSAAERSEEREKIKALRNLHEIILEKMQGMMSPEVRLLNELLAIDDHESAMKHFQEAEPDVRENMRSILPETERILLEQGDDARLEKLKKLQAEISESTLER
ncbi:MAG: CpXC domain-containing protein [Chloroflexi bacterium]|nr:CpXC domain-containing protein [Chloroflexota bacterium]